MSLPVSSVLPALVLAATAARAEAPTPKVRLEVEAKLEVLKRILPDGPAVASGLDGLQRIVERAALRSSLHLEGVSTVPHREIVSEGVGHVPVELAAIVRPVGARELIGNALGDFVEAVGRSARLTTFERLAFEAPADGSLHVSALVRLYYRPPSTPPVEGADLVTAKVVIIERTRSGSDGPARRLQALSRPGVPPIFLTSLTLEGQDVTARGLAPWPTQARDWAPQVDLELKRLEWTQPDACQHFSIEGRFSKPLSKETTTSKSQAEVSAFLLGGSLDYWCALGAKSPRRLPMVRLSGQGPLSVRGRDLDILDVVLLAAHASGQAVVVDDDVSGQVDVELQGATFESAVAALEPLGVYLSPPGRIRRVARGRRPEALPLPPGSEAPVSFWFRRGRLADVFSLLADITGDGVLIPPEPLPPASVYAAEMPWDVLYQAIAMSAGLSVRHEPGLFRVGREGLSVSDLVGTVGGTHGRRGGLESMTGDQVELLALTSFGKVWTAWMLTPQGSLIEYKGSDRFWNGQVISVDSRGVDLRIDITDPLATERFRKRRLDLAPGP